MTLEEYILTYDNCRCNIADYYDTYVKPLSDVFKNRSLTVNNTVVCPLHDDHDPSMGLINHKELKNVKLFHCFGCGRTGTVIRLHQLISARYYDKTLTPIDACKELAQMYDIDIKDYIGKVHDEDYQTKYMQKLSKISQIANNTYTIKDYEMELIKARQHKTVEDRLRNTNTASIKMIATLKLIDG